MKTIGGILYSYNKLPTYIKVEYLIAFGACSFLSMRMPHPYSDILPMPFAVLTVLVLMNLFLKDK